MKPPCPVGVTLWKLIRVLGGGELLEKTLAPVLPSEQLDFELTRLPVVLAANSVFLRSWPHPTYRAMMSERNLGKTFFLSEFVVYIETILRHANWNAIAAIIAAVHFALGEPNGVSTDAESLRSAVQEFQTQNPRIYGDIRKWAETTTTSRARRRQKRVAGLRKPNFARVCDRQLPGSANRYSLLGGGRLPSHGDSVGAYARSRDARFSDGIAANRRSVQSGIRHT
jgi:hypothetical protein